MAFYEQTAAAAGGIGLKTYDVCIREYLDEAQYVVAQGRTPEEAVASLKLKRGVQVLSVSQRPERYQR